VALDRDRKVAFRFDRRGWATAKMGFEAQNQGELKQPVGVGVDVDGGVHVIDAKKHEVENYQAKGGGWLKGFGNEGLFHEVMFSAMSSQREPFVVLMDAPPAILVVDPQTGDPVPYKPTDVKDPALATFSGRFDPSAPKD